MQDLLTCLSAPPWGAESPCTDHFWHHIRHAVCGAPAFACASRPVASQGLPSCQGIIDCGTVEESGAWAISADVLSAFPKLQHDRYEDSDSESGSSDSGTASEDVASWISWFCSLKGNEFFCEVCWPRMRLAVPPLPAVCSQPLGLLRDLPGMQLDLVGRSLLRSQLSCMRPAGRGGLYSG